MVIIFHDELHLFSKSRPFVIFLRITPGTVNGMASQVTATSKNWNENERKIKFAAAKIHCSAGN
jgi:hypothetical protein